MKDLLNKVATVAGHTAAIIQIKLAEAEQYTAEMKVNYLKAKQKGDN